MTDHRDRRQYDRDYEPLPINGDRTISEVLRMLQEVDRRRYESGQQIVGQLQDLRADCQAITQRVEAIPEERRRDMEQCQAEEQARTRQAVEYAARKVAETQFVGRQRGYITWVVGILGGLIVLANFIVVITRF